MPISVGARAVSAADILASRARADTAATTVGVRVTSLLMQAARDLQDLRRRLAARRAAAHLHRRSRDHRPQGHREDREDRPFERRGREIRSFGRRRPQDQQRAPRDQGDLNCEYTTDFKPVPNNLGRVFHCLNTSAPANFEPHLLTKRADLTY